MPPKGKKEGKPKKDAAKELTDEELKQLPAFHKMFKDQVLKNAQNDQERKTIESAYSNSLGGENPHDDFNFALFDLEWSLPKYEDNFNAAKVAYLASLAKKEEPPVKTEQKMEEEFNPNRAWGSYMDRSYYPSTYGQPQGTMYNPMTQSAPTRTPSYPGMEAYHSYSQDPSHMYMMQNQPQIAPSTMQGQYPVSTQGAYPTATTGYPQQVQPGFPQPTQAYPQPTQTAYPQMMAQPQISTQASPYMPATLQSPAHIQPTQPQAQAQPVNIQPQPQPHLQPPQTMQAQPATPQQPAAKAVPEKAEKAAALREQQYQTTTEFETNPNSQIGQDLNSVVPLNYNVMFNVFHKHNKKATDGFYNALYLSVADYVNNLLDELRNICEMDNDAGDLKQYMKVGGLGHEADDARNVLVGMDEGGERKLAKHSQYLVRFSSVQDDQKQIEKIDDKEQKDLEDRYTMSKEDEEDKDKPTKKLKKDVTEEDEVIKFLFKTKKEKGQDNENTYKKTLEINQTLSNLTSRTYSAPKTAHMHDSSAAGANTGKGRKSTASQKRVTMKHMIYYLETNPMYKRTPLLHKAYLK